MAKAVILERIGDAAIETLDHAVGACCPEFCQSMFNAQRRAQFVELVLVAGLALATGEQHVGALFAIVGESFSDRDHAVLVRGQRKLWAVAGILLLIPVRLILHHRRY